MASDRTNRNEKLMMVATLLGATVAVLNLYVGYGRYKDYKASNRPRPADTSDNTGQA